MLRSKSSNGNIDEKSCIVLDILETHIKKELNRYTDNRELFNNNKYIML